MIESGLEAARLEWTYASWPERTRGFDTLSGIDVCEIFLKALEFQRNTSHDKAHLSDV